MNKRVGLAKLVIGEGFLMRILNRPRPVKQKWQQWGWCNRPRHCKRWGTGGWVPTPASYALFQEVIPICTENKTKPEIQCGFIPGAFGKYECITGFYSGTFIGRQSPLLRACGDKCISAGTCTVLPHYDAHKAKTSFFYEILILYSFFSDPSE